MGFSGGEQLFFPGGTDLNPPRDVPDSALTAIDAIIGTCKAGLISDEVVAQLGALVANADPDITPKLLKERIDEMRDGLAKACEEYADVVAKHPDFALAYERVHEMGAQGPGRALRLTAKWTLSDGTTRTDICNPRDMAVHTLPGQIRNHIRRGSS